MGSTQNVTESLRDLCGVCDFCHAKQVLALSIILTGLILIGNRNSYLKILLCE